MMMLEKMEELHLSPKRLSELMGCSQQYVSKVLMGQENHSLETISKVECCLNLQVIPTSPLRNTYNPDTGNDVSDMVPEDAAK